MVSKAFFTGSRYLVEDNDGRHDYLRLNGERFLHALATAGQRVVALPVEADDEKSAYLKTLVALDEGYFAAREFEADADGRYLKHDENAERRFRIRTAERLGDLVDDLHELLSAHDALVDAAVEHVEETESGEDRRRKREEVRAKLLGCTDRAVSGGWYATVEAYYHSLSPGELVAEDRERRTQRIEGTEESRGIRELLGKPHFQRLAKEDLRRIRRVNRESPGKDARVWKRLLDDYDWYLGRERDRSVPAGGASESER
jgi:hypothetical protein